ncbi:hypothetical protein B0T18DRAFT_242841 [Schizothecium vesticola]|uniref:Uncharacterized protein n=1 Tax=Schizothecium vesticola TaxID=314040 RepID=A0AA40EFT3_9PEZI|nr:hypothetical protein B0T18DRAFT_242841 [Schizothecium vesticola]
MARHTVPAPGERTDGCTALSGNHGPCIHSQQVNFTASCPKILQVQAATLPIQRNSENPVSSATAARYYIRHAYNLAAAQARSNQQSIPSLSISGAQSSEDNPPRPCPSDINPRGLPKCQDDGLTARHLTRPPNAGQYGVSPTQLPCNPRHAYPDCTIPSIPIPIPVAAPRTCSPDSCLVPSTDMVDSNVVSCRITHDAERPP